jgi:hypothetical protein
VSPVVVLGAFGKEEIIFTLLEIEPQFPGRLTRFHVNTIKSAIPEIFATTLNVSPVGLDIVRIPLSIREALFKVREVDKRTGVHFRAEDHPVMNATAVTM